MNVQHFTAPAPAAPLTSRSFELGEGDAGTSRTIELIRQAVHDGAKSQTVNRTALEIVAPVKSHDRKAQAKWIYEWVLRYVRFRNDIFGVETLRSADEILAVRAGDCDDINAILLPSLLGTIGFETRLVTVATHPADPNAFTHIYAEVNLNGRWIPIDAARPGARWGRAPERYTRKRIWNIYGNEAQDVGCLNGLGDCACRRRQVSGLAGPVMVKTRGRVYGLRGLGQMGQFDWSSFSDVIDAATQGTAAIVGAARMPTGSPYYNPYGVATTPGLTPGTTYAATNLSPWIIPAVAIVAVVMLLKR